MPCWSLFNIDKIGGSGSSGCKDGNGYTDDLIEFTNVKDDGYSGLMNMDFTKEPPKKLSLIKKEADEKADEVDTEEAAADEINIEDI